VGDSEHIGKYNYDTVAANDDHNVEDVELVGVAGTLTPAAQRRRASTAPHNEGPLCEVKVNKQFRHQVKGKAWNLSV
jgi:hypothetical protein